MAKKIRTERNRLCYVDGVFWERNSLGDQKKIQQLVKIYRINNIL